MKANKTTLGAALDRPGSGVRFYLFYGPDEAGSRALAHRLLKSLGAARFVVTAGAIKGDPALLADEAGAMGLFGDKRLLWIEPAGDEIVEGVGALLDANAVESMAIAIGGSLKRTSTLVKLAEASGMALSHCSYLPEGRDADRMVSELAALEGLRVSGSLSSRIVAAAGANQAIVASELAKFAIFLGASVDSPRELDSETVDRLGADSGEGDVLRIGDLALDGRMAELCEAIQRMPSAGGDSISIIRSLQRRVLQLAPLRARVEAGEGLDGVLASLGKSLFWKDKAMMHRLLSNWTAGRLGQLSERVSALERRLMFSSLPDEAALGEELVAIARAVRR